MEHFAKLDENNVVIDVVIVSKDDLNNLSFPNSESIGIEFLKNITGYNNWKQTSYSNEYRFRAAMIGGLFHPEIGEHGGFSEIKQYDEYVWSEEKCTWVAPIPYPTDGKDYLWNHETLQWSTLLSESPQTITIG